VGWGGGRHAGHLRFRFGVHLGRLSCLRRSAPSHCFGWIWFGLASRMGRCRGRRRRTHVVPSLNHIRASNPATGGGKILS
jgi:hypothetical protein